MCINDDCFENSPRYDQGPHRSHQKWLLQTHSHQQKVCEMLDSLRNVESAQFNSASLRHKQISSRPILFARFQFHRGWFHRTDGFPRYCFSKSHQMRFLQIRSIWFHSTTWCTLRNGLEYHPRENLCNSLVLVLATVCCYCRQHGVEIRNADIVFNVRNTTHFYSHN